MLRGLISSAPLTCVFLAVLWAVGLATASLRHGPGESLLREIGIGLPALADGKWWTPLTSAFWSPHLAGYLVATVLIMALTAPMEARLGWRVVAAVFLVSQIFGTLIGLGLVKLSTYIGQDWPSYLSDDLTVTPMVGVMGVGAAFSAWLSTLWRRRLRLFLFTLLVIFALYIGFLGQLLPLVGALVGLGLGLLLHGRAKDAGHFRPSFAETRVLVAILVAVSALGALVSVIVDTPIGPLSDYSDLLATNRPGLETVTGVCGDPSLTEFCRQLRAEEISSSGWGELTSLAPALLMLVAAEGLRRGRRMAWWLALALKLMVIGFGLWIVLDDLSTAEGSRAAYLASSLLPLLLPLVTVVVLLVTRKVFTIDTPRRLLRPMLAWFAIVLVGLSAVYVLLGRVQRADFDPPATVGALLLDLPSRFLPPVYASLLPTRLVPTAAGTRALFSNLGTLFWLIVLIGLLLLWWRKEPSDRDAIAKTRARGLLSDFGGSTLSYMATWPGNDYWFTSLGNAAVAYRVIATVALTTGDPFGEESARPEAVRGFAEFCARNGWTPCFYSVGAATRDTGLRMGWKAAQIAEDTVVPLQDLAFTGKKWQDVRTALNKASKEGITAQWWRYPEAPLAVTDQIRMISEEWVADKGLPEMGFTLGGLDELDDPNVRCLVAVDADRTVHGVTSWLPVYAQGEIVGWTLDFMRRRADRTSGGSREHSPAGFRGVMEFLIASAALGFQAEGARFISLSGAPLARLDRGEVPDALQRLLDVTGKAMEPVYGFRSLFAFKAKFQPTYEPLYMVYPDAMALPAIGNAVGRAYLPSMTPVQGVRLIRAFRGTRKTG